MPIVRHEDSVDSVGGHETPIRDNARASVTALVRQYPWPIAEAERVFGCESHMNPYPDDNGTSVGPAQINAPYHMDDLAAVLGYAVGDVGDAMRLLRDPAINIATAYHIWGKDGGFFAWGCN